MSLSPEGDETDQIKKFLAEINAHPEAKREIEREERENGGSEAKGDPVCHRASYVKE